MIDETTGYTLPDPHPTIRQIVVFGEMAEEDLVAVGHAVRERFGSLRSCGVRTFILKRLDDVQIELAVLTKTARAALGKKTLVIRVAHGFRLSESGVRIGYVAQGHALFASQASPGARSDGEFYPASSAWVQFPYAKDSQTVIDAFLAGRDFCREVTNGRFSRQYFLAQAAELAVSFVPGL